jgi:hypothetical protein
MSAFKTDEEDRRTQALPAKLTQAIGASLDELHRLAEEAVPEPTPLGLELGAFQPSLPFPPELESEVPITPGAGPDTGPDFVIREADIGVFAFAEMKAVTRTERGVDDRFRLDLNVSLEGLDAYEVQSVQRVLAQHFRSLIAAARQENSEARITQLLRAVAPPDPLADVELKVAEATVDLRREFLERVPVLTSAQLHERAGFPGNNPSQTGLRWRKQGKLFSINHGGRELYPAFQLGPDGRPLPIVAELLEILARDPDRTEWDNVLWFAGESGWLDGKTPLELLQSEPALVKQAAEQEVLRDES